MSTPTTRLVTPVLLLAALTVATAQTIVVAALPVLGRELGVGAGAATWLLTAFMLAAGVVTPIAGRLGDLYGHRRVMVICLAALTAGSVLATLPSFPAVLAGRIVQGLSAGVFPVTFGLARGIVPARRLPGVVAGLSATFGVGGALGMVIAGPVVAVTDGAALFWLCAVLAAAALAGTRLLPAAAGRRTAGGGPARPDLPGAALLSGTLVALLLGISEARTWGRPALVLIGVSVLLGVVFLRVESRTADPMIDVRLLRSPALAGTNIATAVISIGMFAAVTVIPRFSQTPPAAAGYGFGDSPAATGLLLAPTALLMVLTVPLTPRLAARFGSRATFQLGALLAVLSLGALGFAHDHRWQFYVLDTVLGAAYGFAFASLGALVVGAASPSETGAATGINTVLRTIGGAVGAQLAAAVLTSATRAPAALPTESGYVTAFLAAAGVAAVAFAAALTIRRPAAAPAPDEEPAGLKTP